MFTCKRCKKKVATIDSKNQQCVECNREIRNQKVEVPKTVVAETPIAKEPKPVVIDEKKDEKTEAKWP